MERRHTGRGKDRLKIYLFANERCSQAVRDSLSTTRRVPDLAEGEAQSGTLECGLRKRKEREGEAKEAGFFVLPFAFLLLFPWCARHSRDRSGGERRSGGHNEPQEQWTGAGKRVHRHEAHETNPGPGNPPFGSPSCRPSFDPEPAGRWLGVASHVHRSPPAQKLPILCSFCLSHATNPDHDRIARRSDSLYQLPIPRRYTASTDSGGRAGATAPAKLGPLSPYPTDAANDCPSIW